MSLPLKSILFALIGFLIVAQNKLLAQTETEAKAAIFTAKNSIHAEFLGNSGGYAINYGRIFYQKEKLKLAASAGFSLFYKSEDQPFHSGYVIPVFPAEITAFWGKSNHHLEFGVGFNTFRTRRYTFDEDFPNNIREQSYWNKSIIPRIGYRYQKPAGGVFFRAGYTPSIGFGRYGTSENQVHFIPYGLGISLGFSF